MSNNKYIVINKDEDKEDSFDSALEARSYLLSLITIGVSAYMLTAPLYKL
jgi:hypothetical protein